MAIVVFGGSGFIGSHLIRLLHQAGEGPIISVDLKPPKTPLGGVIYRIHDARDLSGFNMDETVKRIYNFAAIHQTPGHETAEYYETNIAGAVEVTDFARRHDVREVVFTSSISVYGPSEEPKTEFSRPDPRSAYGASKLLAETIHRKWAQENDLRRLIIVRPAVVFGPGENGNFTRLARLMRKGWFVYPGRKDTIKACIYVDDLIASIEQVRRMGEHIVVFNGCYPDRYTIENIVETFRKHHFPNARTLKVPLYAMMVAARVLQAVRFISIGIHPERILKLVRSTDIVPGWLSAHDLARPDALAEALSKWAAASGGRFD
jgi:nucleoside-diphosphate-sugar epimerase